MIVVVVVADAFVACAYDATDVVVAHVVAIMFATSPTFIVLAYDDDVDVWYVYVHIMIHAYQYRVPYRNRRTGTAKYVSEKVKQRTTHSVKGIQAYLLSNNAPLQRSRTSESMFLAATAMSFLEKPTQYKSARTACWAGP